MKIKKLKIKLNKDNEYSEYRYFIPKSKNITLADGMDIDTAVDSLKARIAQLKEQASYLISKAPLVKYAEGSSITATQCADAPLKKFTIEGDSYQETRGGKNLLHVTALTTEIDGVTFTINPDGTILINGTNTGNTNIAFELCAPGELLLNANTSYKILGKPAIDLENPGVYLQVTYYKDGARVYATADKEFSTIEENTDNEQGAYVYIRFDKGITVENLMIYPMVISATENNYQYEQYGASPSLDYPSEIQSIEATEIYVNNRNLFDKNNALKAIAAKEAEYVSTAYIPVKPGDIITKNNKTYLFIYDNTKTQIVSKTGWTTGTIEEENAAYVRCNVSKTELDTFMIVKNQELPTQYIKGQSQIKTLQTQQPLRAIGDVKDEFIKIDNKFFERHYINRYIFTGKENWTDSSDNDDIIIFKLNSFGNESGLNYCNALPSNLVGYYEKIDTRTKDAVYIGVKRTRLNNATVSEFKTWLSKLYELNTPIYIDYICKKPVDIECTQEQIEILEKIKTYKGTTYIDLNVIDILRPNMKVAYKQDLNLLIEEGI